MQNKKRKLDELYCEYTYKPPQQVFLQNIQPPSIQPPGIVRLQGVYDSEFPPLFQKKQPFDFQIYEYENEQNVNDDWGQEGVDYEYEEYCDSCGKEWRKCVCDE